MGRNRVTSGFPGKNGAFHRLEMTRKDRFAIINMEQSHDDHFGVLHDEL